jgi:hypothetical protein
MWLDADQKFFKFRRAKWCKLGFRRIVNGLEKGRRMRPSAPEPEAGKMAKFDEQTDETANSLA